MHFTVVSSNLLSLINQKLHFKGLKRHAMFQRKYVKGVRLFNERYTKKGIISVKNGIHYGRGIGLWDRD